MKLLFYNRLGRLVFLTICSLCALLYLIVVANIRWMKIQQAEMLPPSSVLTKLEWFPEENLSANSQIDAHLFAYNPDLPTNYSKGRKAEKETKHLMSNYIINRLNKMKHGFFVECGAYDGVYLSNSLMLEKLYNWTGLLIEADPVITPILKKRNRRAWVSDVCLSPMSYPINATMRGEKSNDVLSFIEEYATDSVHQKPAKSRFPRKFTVECYPLHMMLDFLGRTDVDYFSLDVEGLELRILKTIPWHRIHIKLISVEVRTDTKLPVRRYLESIGYKKIRSIVVSSEYIHDDVYELREG